MAAYAALVSIMQIFDQIENHPSPPISLDKKQVESLNEIVLFLQKFLEGYKSPFADGDEADPLEMRIADAAHAAEDAIESHIVYQILPPVSLYKGKVKVRKHMYLIMKKVMEIVAVKDQLMRLVTAFYGSSKTEHLYKLIEYMNLIEKKMLESVAFKDQQQRRVSEDLYESLVKMIVDMDLIQNEMTVFVFELRGLVLAFDRSSIYADLYKDMQKLIEKMNSIKKEVMEIVALNDQLQIQVPPFSGTSTSVDLYESLVRVIEDMDLIKKEVMLLEVEVVADKDQLQRQVLADAGGSSTPSKSSLSRPNSTAMVGFDDVMRQLKEKLIFGEPGRQVIPIVGMGGIGKTTLATNVYAEPHVCDHFDICAWVTISQQFNTKELLYEILSQANKEGMDRLSQMTEDEIGLALHKCLLYRRYLIVLDDMWSVEAWEEMQCYFHDCDNGSRIIVTTRLSNLGSQLNSTYALEMKFMDEKSSWDLLCKIVFRGKSCPLELKEIGEKIVKSCKGLPLSINVIGGLLDKLERTKECWKSIRRRINSLVNLEDDKHCLKILKLSYNHLPVYLKSCFIYLGTFKEDSRIRVSKVIKLWVSEGFLKPMRGKSLETIAKEYLDELVDRNLLRVHEFGKTGNMKYLKMHDLLRDLCLREAEKERFYHVVGQHSPQGMCSQRRVVISRSTSKEKVVDVMKSTPHARSYIRDHGRIQPLPNLKLLRILKAPYEKHRYSPEKMINLRFLQVRSDDYRQLPSSIDLLWSLQTLIGSHSGEHNNAPVEIWNMSQLRHVYFRVDRTRDGRARRGGVLHLPDPPSGSIVIMENLQTLKTVRNFKCDEMMVRRIPNIRKLGLIESCDDTNASLHNIRRLQKLESLSYESFHNIRRLQKLESLSYESFYRRSLPQKRITFPNSLKNLTLGIRHGRMEGILKKVSRLPFLQKLKLSHGDFTTGIWKTVEAASAVSNICHLIVVTVWNAG